MEKRSNPLGEAQTALLAVNRMRSLLACDGWTEGMAAHIQKQRDELAARILDDDSLGTEERERLREAYKVHRDLLAWPERTLEAQGSVLKATSGGEVLGD